MNWCLVKKWQGRERGIEGVCRQLCVKRREFDIRWVPYDLLLILAPWVMLFTDQFCIYRTFRRMGRILFICGPIFLGPLGLNFDQFAPFKFTIPCFSFLKDSRSNLTLILLLVTILLGLKRNFYLKDNWALRLKSMVRIIWHAYFFPNSTVTLSPHEWILNLTFIQPIHTIGLRLLYFLKWACTPPFQNPYNGTTNHSCIQHQTSMNV